MTSLFIIEEHHEAFFIWRYAVLNQIIPDNGNTLLHVDEHSDMNLPTLSASLNEIGPELQDTFSFVRNNLGISEFVIPAAYQGLFDHICWMRRSHASIPRERTLNVLSYKGEGKQLIVTDNFLQAGILNPDRKSVGFHRITTETPIELANPVILDIDLDYFYCDFITGETFEVEITENEYRAFCENPYHRLRMTSGGKLRAQKRDSSFYYIYHPGIIRETPKFNAAEVAQHIDDFASWLQKQDIRPMLIDICRSRISGYTPEEHWQWIEESLLHKLGELYPIHITYYSEIFDAMGLS